MSADIDTFVAAHVAACCLVAVCASLVSGAAACVFAVSTWLVVLWWQAVGGLP